MDDELSLPMVEFIFLVCLMYRTCIVVSLQIAALAQSMAVGDASQTTPVQFTDVFMLCCSTQIELCNFDSCKSLKACSH